MVITQYILIALDLNIFQNEIKKFIKNKNIIRNIYRIQACDSIMCRYFCTRFNDFMLNGKSVLDYTNLFSPNDYEKNYKKNTKIDSITKKIKMKKLY